MIERYLVPGSFVLSDGQIDTFGTIRILATDVRGRIRRSDGLRLYSPVLHRHHDGIAYVDGDCITIKDAAGSVIDTVSHKGLYSIDFERRGKVLPSGFVSDVSDIDHSSGCLTSRYVTALETAATGKKPTFCDNSPFPRVDPSLAGTSVVVLRLDSDTMAVFHPDGTPIPHTVERPLAFETWGESFAPIDGFLLWDPYDQDEDDSYDLDEDDYE